MIGGEDTCMILFSQHVDTWYSGTLSTPDVSGNTITVAKGRRETQPMACEGSTVTHVETRRSTRTASGQTAPTELKGVRILDKLIKW